MSRSTRPIPLFRLDVDLRYTLYIHWRGKRLFEPDYTGTASSEGKGVVLTNKTSLKSYSDADARSAEASTLWVRRTLMQLSIAEFTYDELHCPFGPDEGAVAERAVATDAVRPIRTHIRAQAPEHRNTPLVQTRSNDVPILLLVFGRLISS